MKQTNHDYVRQNISFLDLNNYKTGVYKITCNDTGHFIIGSSNNCKERFYEHFRSLKRNKHWNRHMQFRFNKHPNNWSFDIIEFVEPIREKLLETEQKYIDINFGSELCMNINKNAYVPSFSGFNHSEKTKEKIKLHSARLGKPGTMKGKKHSQETKEKMSKIHQNYRHSEKTKEKIRQGKKGNNWNKGRKHTQEFKDKIKASWILRRQRMQKDFQNTPLLP